MESRCSLRLRLSATPCSKRYIELPTPRHQLLLVSLAPWMAESASSHRQRQHAVPDRCRQCPYAARASPVFGWARLRCLTRRADVTGLAKPVARHSSPTGKPLLILRLPQCIASRHPTPRRGEHISPLQPLHMRCERVLACSTSGLTYGTLSLSQRWSDFKAVRDRSSPVWHPILHTDPVDQACTCP